MTPKTIQIFLPTGDPTGVRIAEITTSIVKAIEFPRHEVETVLKMPETKQVGLYLLFGEDDESGEKLLYIGQSGDLSKRVAQHHQTKDFWTKAVLFISLTNNWTQTHVTLLEWLAIKQAKEAERFILQNGNEGSKPFTPLPLEADCHEIFSVAQVLLGTLGHPVFKPLTTKKEVKQNLFYLTRNGLNGKGLLTDEGFVVLSGSEGVPTVPEKYQDKLNHVRSKLSKNGVVTIDNQKMIFNKDYLFKTPSGAAFALLAMPSNGWIDWKNKQGQTLDEVYRKGSNEFVENDD